MNDLELDAEIAGLGEADLPVDVAKLESLVERELALTKEVRDYGSGAQLGRLSASDKKHLDERVAELERVHAQGNALAPTVLEVAAHRALLTVRLQARREKDRAELTRTGAGYLRSAVQRRAGALRTLLEGRFPVSS